MIVSVSDYDRLAEQCVLRSMHQLGCPIEQVHQVHHDALWRGIFVEEKRNEASAKVFGGTVALQLVIDDYRSEIEEVSARPRGIETSCRNGMKSRGLDRVLQLIQSILVGGHQQDEHASSLG